MNTLDMVRDYLERHGFAGLAAEDCGCGLGDLAPCGTGPFPDCHAAMSRVLGPDEYVGECGPGDTCFFQGELEAVPSRNLIGTANEKGGNQRWERL